MKLYELVWYLSDPLKSQ